MRKYRGRASDRHCAFQDTPIGKAAERKRQSDSARSHVSRWSDSAIDPIGSVPIGILTPDRVIRLPTLTGRA